MKKVIINAQDFKSILDAVEHSVSHDAAYPALHYIRLTVEKQRITAYTLDKYRASRFVLNCDSDNADEFTCYIKPIPFNAPKRNTPFVKITYDEEIAKVEFNSKYGRVGYEFEQPTWGELDIETLYKEAEQNQNRVGINARYLEQALRSVDKLNRHTDTFCTVKSGKPTSPLLICAKNGRIENSQLILPIRILEGSEE